MTGLFSVLYPLFLSSFLAGQEFLKVKADSAPVVDYLDIDDIFI
jgi:hypothetical protein